MTDLPHLAARVFNTPLLISRPKLETILDAIGPRLLEGGEIAQPPASLRPGARRNGPAGFEHGGYLLDEGIAVLPVIGTLVRRGGFLDAASGLMSYARLQNAVTEILLAPSVRGLMLELDTPGGEAQGVFDLAETIRALSEETGKPIWAHANEMADSAGYAIASVAGRIWLARTAEVGSIGVVIAHIDVSEADRMAGRRWTYIHAGERKVDGNPHEPLPDRVRDDLQRDVDHIYGLFVDLVARGRGLSAAAIRATEADIYRGEAALAVGLADQVGTFDQALGAFARHLDDPGSAGAARSAAAAKHRRTIMTQRLIADQEAAAAAQAGPAEEPATEEHAAAAASEQETDPAPAPAPDETEPSGGEPEENEGSGGHGGGEEAAATTGPDDSAERRRSEELAAVAEQARGLGVAFDLGAAIRDGTHPDTARRQVLESLAAADEGRVTHTVVDAPSPGTSEHPRRARSMWDRAIETVRSRF